MSSNHCESWPAAQHVVPNSLSSFPTHLNQSNGSSDPVVDNSSSQEFQANGNKVKKKKGKHTTSSLDVEFPATALAPKPTEDKILVTAPAAADVANVSTLRPAFPSTQTPYLSDRDTKSLHRTINVLAEKVNRIELRSSKQEQRQQSTTPPNLPPLFSAPLPTLNPAAPVDPPLLPDLPRDHQFQAKTARSEVAYFPAPSAGRRHIPEAPPRPSHNNLTDALDTFRSDRDGAVAGPTRYRYHSSSSSVSSEASSIASTRQHDKVNTHTDLLPCFETGEVFDDDLVATIVPFDRKVYVSYHNFSSVDLEQYMILLKYAQPDHWYVMPDQKTLNAIGGWEDMARLKGCEVNMQRIEEHMSSIEFVFLFGQASHSGTGPDTKMTRINAGRALRLIDDVGPDCECQQRVRPADIKLPPCETKPCYEQVYKCKQLPGLVWYPCVNCRNEQRLPRSPVSDMTYLSVIQTYPDNNDGFGNGRPIYKVVRSGSRRAAAAQAFSDAGAHGWSTVFVCALPAQVSIWSETAKYANIVGKKHARSIDELLVHRSYYGKDWLSILY